MKTNLKVILKSTIDHIYFHNAHSWSYCDLFSGGVSYFKGKKYFVFAIFNHYVMTFSSSEITFLFVMLINSQIEQNRFHSGSILVCNAHFL